MDLVRRTLGSYSASRNKTVHRDKPSGFRNAEYATLGALE
jgi:hypothetical protein